MGFRVNFSNDPTAHEEVDREAKIHAFESKSRPGMKHYTTVFPNGKVDCTCEGWRNNRKCWHVFKVLEQEE